MASFADYFTLKLGEAVVKGRRLTLKEIREHGVEFAQGALDVEKTLEIIASHVTLADGSKFDPLELSEAQARQLLAEMVLPKEGRQISDFIGLFS